MITVQGSRNHAAQRGVGTSVCHHVPLRVLNGRRIPQVPTWMPYFRILGFYIHWLHPVLINVKLSAAIIRTSRHKQTWESVCIHFSRLSINFRRAISHHAACCHVVSVIVRNEIIEMFPSSINTFPDFFFYQTACTVLFWLRLCWSKWAQHMPRRAYANRFVYQSGSQSALCVSFRLSWHFPGRRMFYAFFGGLFYLFIYLFILFFLSLVRFYRHDATIHK